MGKTVFLVLVLAAILVAAALLLGLRPSQAPDAIAAQIDLPPGFKIAVFADKLAASPVSYPGPNTGPRMLLLKDGVLYTSVTGQGKIAAMPDANQDGKADLAVTFMDGLANPHGLDYHDGWFYVAEEDKVIRVQDADNDLHADSGNVQKLLDLPSGSGHFTRTLKIHNGSLYVSIGSSCNVCHEQDGHRASLVRCGLDGSNCSIFAKGLRNAVGLAFHPASGKLYATENGRDLLGDDLPPDEINLIEEGRNYGWPACYGNNVHDTDFDKNTYIRNPCMEPFEAASYIGLQAHSAPLGLAFYSGSVFPAEYANNLFVAFHGSWNRQQPTGYKVVRIDPENKVHDFATGWLQNGKVLGRPVDVLATDKELFVSDDNAGRVYRIWYAG